MINEEHELEEDTLLNYKSEPAWCFQRCCKVPRIFCFLGVPLLFVVFILIGFFLILPQIIQGVINGSKVEVQSLVITQPYIDSFHLNITLEMSHYGPTNIMFQGTTGEIFYQKTLLGTIIIPQFILTGDSLLLNIESEFQIADINLLGTYCLDILKSNENVSWQLKASSHALVLGSNMTLHFNKEILINGLNGLSNVQIKSFKMPTNHPLGGVDVAMVVEKNLDSPFGIDLGIVTFDLHYEDVFIGRVQSSTSIRSGNNQLSMLGYLRPSNLTVASQLFSNYVNNIPSPIRITGITVNNVAPWIQSMATSIDIWTTLNGVNLTLLSDIHLNNFQMELYSDVQLFNGATAESNFYFPFGFPFTMVEFSFDFRWYFQNVIVANLSLPTQHSVHYQKELLTFDFAHIPLQVVDGGIFSKLLSALILTEKAVIGFEAIGRFGFASAMGNFALFGISAKQEIVLPGMEGFHQHPITIPSITVLHSSPTEVELTMEMSIMNPSVNFTSINFPFKVIYENTEIGNSTITPFYLHENQNSLNATTFFNINNETKQPIQDFLNHHAKGESIDIELLGNPNACPISYLREALENLNTTARVDGFKHKLNSLIHFDLQDKTPKHSKNVQ